MIHAFNFTGSRDMALSNMMAKSFHKYCRYGAVSRHNVDGLGYGNGAGWNESMLKLNAFREVAERCHDNDWVLSIDSDVVFTSNEIFSWINIVSTFRYSDYSIIGIQQAPPLAMTHINELRNMSGCSIYIRGDIAKKMSALTKEQLDEVHSQFRAYTLCENEDVVLSYLAQMLGAKSLSIPERLYGDSLEQDYLNNSLKSFYHLNYGGMTTFLSEPVTGKWDIPAVLAKKGIVL